MKHHFRYAALLKSLPQILCLEWSRLVIVSKKWLDAVVKNADNLK